MPPHYRRKLQKPSSKEDQIRRGFGRVQRHLRVYGDPKLHERQAAEALNNANNVFEVCRVYQRICWNKFTAPLKPLRDLTIATFGRIGAVREARAVFESMERPTVESHQRMFHAYASNGHLPEAKQIFLRMRDVSSDWWVEMMSAYARFGYVAEAKEIFDWMPEEKSAAKSLLLIAYARSGYITQARCVLKSIKHPMPKELDEMLAAYGIAGDVRRARKLFNSMKSRSSWSWDSLLQAFATTGDLVNSKRIFGLMPLISLASRNWMIVVFGRNGLLDEASEIFGRMPERNVESCNSLLAAFAQNGKLKRASRLFNEMMHFRDKNSWASMMQACSQFDQASQALWMFHSTSLYGLWPDPVVFVLVLSACRELKLIDQGRSYFQSIVSDFSYVPVAEHYYALAQLLGTCSESLDDAEELLNSMPFFVPVFLWKWLLDLCERRLEIERASRVVDKICELEGDDSSDSVVKLVRMYFNSGRVDEAVTLMIKKGLHNGKDVDGALKLIVG